MNNSDFAPEELVAIDTETTGLRTWKGDRAFGVSLCDERGNTWYCDWYVDPTTREVIPIQEDLDFINKYTSDPSFEKIYHNAKFDCRMLDVIGIQMAGKIHDTHIAARVCNNVEFSLKLKVLAAKYLGMMDSDEKDLKLAVGAARRRAKAIDKQEPDSAYHHNLGADAAQDYWLPKYFDPDNDMCEKYCRLDTVRTMGLHLMYQEAMEEDKYLKDAYEFEMKLWHTVNRMENRGMRVSESEIREQNRQAHHDKEEHYSAMLRIIREGNLNPFKEGSDLILDDFNPNSSQQIQRILYLPESDGGLGLTTHRMNDSGSLSTDKKALRELMVHPFVRHLVQYRSADQAITLFFDKYLELMIDDPICEGTKILRPGMNQCGTVTFRFSSSDPNLQQVGNPDTAANTQLASYQARAPFGPRPGYNLYGGDYSQQELRIFAYIAHIPFLLDTIASGGDPNSACANKAWGGKGNPQAIKAASYALDLGREEAVNEKVAEIWGEVGWNRKASQDFGFYSQRSYEVADFWLSRFDYDIVKAEKSLGRSNSRGRAKCVVFAKIYGGGPSSVTELLYCSMDEAREFMSDYDKAIPELNIYMRSMINKAKKDGYIVNPYGRKVRVESGYEYRSVNYMIQSTAACMMKDAMMRCDEYLISTGLDAHVLMSIHDEMLFEIRKEHAHKRVLRNLVNIMCDTKGRIGVPMNVELKRSVRSWAEKEPVSL